MWSEDFQVPRPKWTIYVHLGWMLDTLFPSRDHKGIRREGMCKIMVWVYLLRFGGCDRD